LPGGPEDPEEALEGTTVATADYIRSFDGPLLGKKGTEYGEKQNDYRVEFRLRYYFGL
jgi:hypothetical protein